MSGRNGRLPERLLVPLTRLHTALERGKFSHEALVASVAEMNRIDPDAALAREALWPPPFHTHGTIQDDWLHYVWRHPKSAAHKLLYNSRGLPRWYSLVQMLGIRGTAFRRGVGKEVRLLAKHPDLAPIFIRHPVGYLREPALKALKAEAVSPFVLASVMYRLNDWVAPVRAEAAKAVQRLLPAMSAKTIAAAAPALAKRSIHWGRIDEHRGALAEMIERPDVIALIVDNLKFRPAAGSTALLYMLMKRPEIDVWLPMLAREALTPAIRAIASKALICGVAKWPTGQEFRIVPNYSGNRKSVIIFGERPLTSGISADEVIAGASLDRAASVRKLAADAVIEKRASPEMADAIILRLKGDPSNTVRSRIDYVLRHRAEFA